MSPPSLSNGRKVELPVAVMASYRPTYLYRMLRTLQKVHGLVPSMVTVYIEGLQDEPAAIARLFGLRLEQHKPVGQGRARIHQVRTEGRGGGVWNGKGGFACVSVC